MECLVLGLRLLWHHLCCTLFLLVFLAYRAFHLCLSERRLCFSAAPPPSLLSHTLELASPELSLELPCLLCLSISPLPSLALMRSQCSSSYLAGSTGIASSSLASLVFFSAQLSLSRGRCSPHLSGSDKIYWLADSWRTRRYHH